MNIFRPSRSLARQPDTGFTLVELMVVVAIIILLATITVVSYGVWRTTTAENAVQSELNSLASGMESYRNWNDGYPVLSNGTEFDGSAGTRDIFEAGDSVTVTYINGDKSNYCVEGVSVSQPDVIFHASAVDNSRSIDSGGC